MKKINRDAAALHRHVFGNPEATLRAVGMNGASIHHALWTVEDAAFLLAVNTRDCSKAFEIDVADACGRQVVSGQRIFDDRDLPLEGGVIRDECASLSRYLYRFVLAPANP
jgi:hypothetical protein